MNVYNSGRPVSINEMNHYIKQPRHRSMAKMVEILCSKSYSAYNSLG